MTILAHVIHVKSENLSESLGVYRFSFPPRSGECLEIMNAGGSIAIFKVLFVSHLPLNVADSQSDETPSVTLHVEFHAICTDKHS